MQLYFLRHGEALRNGSFSDADRPLTDLGRQQAAIVGEALALLHVNIDFLLTSPLLRARETGAIVQSFICAKRMTTTDYLTNDSTPKQLCEFLRTQKSESPLLIGHEPFLSEMLSLLIGDIRHAQIEMHCCSLALVKMESSLHYGSGVLEMLVHPGLLRPWLKQ